MSEADFTNKTVKEQMTKSTGKLNLKTAEEERVQLTAQQQKQIQKLYENVSKDIAKQAEKAPRTSSEALRQEYLNQLQKQVNRELNKIQSEVETTVTGNMKKTAEAVVDDNIAFLKKLGLPVEGAFSHVPDRIVRSVATGQLYEGKWSLSKALWKNTQKTQKDVQTVVAQGIAQNKSAYDIAKDLEKYVDPSARKDWDWSKVYPGTAKKVDYNAQRLARTMVSHAYQQSFVETTKKNPFVTKYQWLSSGGERMCDICEARNEQYYDKDDLPLDHPMGMCTFVAVIEDSTEEMVNRLADWANGADDPELDTWMESLGVQVEKSDIPKAPEKHLTPEEMQQQLFSQREKDIQSLGKSFIGNMTEYEKDCIYQYTSDGYEVINEYLRSKGTTDNTVRVVTESIETALSKNKLPTDMVVKRSTDFSELVGFLPSDSGYSKDKLSSLSVEQLNELLSGTMGRYDSFISTTYKPFGTGDAFENSPLDLNIYLPKGTEACPIETISEYKKEREILVNSGYDARIIKIVPPEDEENWNLKASVYIELIPKG